MNACDAGREGELIFAYIYETAKADKPVKRLWLNSMTTKAIEDAFDAPARRRGDGAARGRRPLALRGRLGGRHERDARRHDPAARRLRRRRLAGPRADADAGARRPPRGGDPRLQARALLAGRGGLRRRRASASTRGRYLGGKRHRPRSRPPRSSRTCSGKPGEITKLEKKEERERSQLLYDLTSLQRHANTRYGFSAKRTLAAAQKLYEQHKAITYPRTNSRWLSGDMVARDPAHRRARRAQRASTRRAPPTSPRSRSCRSARVVNDKKVEDHHAIIPTRPSTTWRRWGRTRRRSTTSSPSASSPSSIPTRSSSARASRPRWTSTCSARAAG